METLSTYLDSMFAKLPDTAEVRRAREEIWQMMEDKYNECIAEGKSENEAIGKVISEFGSLEELADGLGLDQIISPENDTGIHPSLMMEEIQSFLEDGKKYALLQALAVGLCIACMIPPILMESRLGSVLMFLMVGCGVAIFIVNGVLQEKWEYIEKEGYVPDMESMAWIREERERYQVSYAVGIAVGVLLCIFSIALPIIADVLPKIPGVRRSDIGASGLFLFVAAGVFLIVKNGLIHSQFTLLLRTGRRRQAIAQSGAGSESQPQETQYIHPVITQIMSVYWTTVTAIYLCWSFLSFDWDKTWIIWPVAAGIQIIANATLKKEEG